MEDKDYRLVGTSLLILFWCSSWEILENSVLVLNLHVTHIFKQACNSYWGFGLNYLAACTVRFNTKAIGWNYKKSLQTGSSCTRVEDPNLWYRYLNALRSKFFAIGTVKQKSQITYWTSMGDRQGLCFTEFILNAKSKRFLPLLNAVNDSIWSRIDSKIYPWAFKR